MSDDIKFNSIGDSIVHITLPDKKKLAQAMIRFQEFYESQHEDIRGNVFTLGYLRSKGGRNKPGVNTYEGGENHDAEWSGYNFPGCALDLFIKGLFDPLTSYEKDIVEALRYREDRFYVIGTIDGEDPKDTLEHEICHALYYIEPKYKAAVDKILDQYDLRNLKKMLAHWGYCDDVLQDECHAYISADYDWLLNGTYKGDVEKFKVKIDKKIHDQLRRVRARFPIKG